MGRLFITGDTHNIINITKFYYSNFPVQMDLTKDDIIFILGDFGGIWNGGEDEQSLLKWYESKNWTTVFLDGNHENFDLLKQYPVVDFNGAAAHKINDSIYHIMRGEVMELNNKKFFILGGAESVDKKERIEGKSWWKEESISPTEFAHSLDSLKDHEWKIDYVLTHTGGTSINNFFGYTSTQSDLFLDTILKYIDYKQHFCGHLHEDVIVDQKSRVLYDDIIEIDIV